MITHYLSSLIKLYPFYGTSGLLQAQEWVQTYLETNGWDLVSLDKYNAFDIKNNKNYVDVLAFGEPYQNYELIEKYNVIAIKNGTSNGPTLILNGHIDVDIVDESKTWFTPEGWKSGSIIDGKIYGRGSADMLGGLLALMTASSKFIKNHSDFSGKIIFSSVCDEEIGGNGTLRFLEKLQGMNCITADTFSIIGEPTENKPCLDSLGFMHVTIHFSRDPIHMGIAAKEHSALNDVLDFLSRFPKIFSSLIPENQQSLCKYNFGLIKGGIDPAIPIGDIEISGTIFYPECMNKSIFFENLKKSIETSYPAKVTEGNFGFSGASFPPNKLTDAVNIECTLFPSPCDARLFKEYSIPTIIWGPGSLAQAHSVNEYISIEQLKEYEELVYGSICRFFGKK